MRIVGGTLRGRTLKTPSGTDTRPTADRVREAVFNILLHHDFSVSLENACVIDAFAGSGALGLESLSRGAQGCAFFEKDRKALACLGDNLSLLEDPACAVVMPLDVLRGTAFQNQLPRPADLVFFDPPYHKGLIAPAFQSLYEKGWIAPKALLVCEMAADEAAGLPFAPVFERVYGDTRVGFYNHPHLSSSGLAEQEPGDL
ncbi:MAG: 16S rRNA (guanine(966)-N(2))-methyltransferase RsmD, partial [Alphaproteobacteria bacterium]|nr:16S rRNA (guanine(966)-N(2))-methyltransferase RsmD [Alphaproteobacteria bacterium]